jgi:pantetheine-phosphate adenylyltransferase
MPERVALYPGSFDPVTNGHLDVLFRARRLADKVIVAILENDEKRPLFSLEERMEMIREIVGDEPSVSIQSFSGLLVDFAAQTGATLLVRGLRAISDYEYELQMALMNRHLDPQIETVFMMPAEQYTYVSSRLIKEIASLGGPLKGLVPPIVEARLVRRRSGARSRRV